MSKSDRLCKLFSEVGAENWDSAVALAEGICAHEEFLGHTTVARLLRSSLRSGASGKTNGRVNKPLQSTISSALTKLKGKESLSDLFLRKRHKQEIEELVQEWRNRIRILKSKLPVRSKVLFHGPPGCGKSLTSLAIGNELGLPSYIVRFDAVIGSYLGQTAVNLRQIFQFAETTPCIVILDELDALGKKRGNPLDVGELDRIVISLMQELEHSSPAGIVIATSNLPRHLDDALWRRFDLVVAFPKPTKAELLEFARIVGKRYSLRISSGLRTSVEKCSSLADVEKCVQDAARRMLLRELK